MADQIIPGIMKEAAGAKATTLLRRLVSGMGKPEGVKAFSDIGGKAIRYLGGGTTPVTRGLQSAWKASPGLRRATAGALTGGGAGSMYGAVEGYRDGGLPGAMWGGFRRGMTGAGVGGVVGGLGGKQIYKGIGALGSGAGRAAKDFTKG